MPEFYAEKLHKQTTELTKIPEVAFENNNSNSEIQAERLNKTFNENIYVNQNEKVALKVPNYDAQRRKSSVVSKIKEKISNEHKWRKWVRKHETKFDKPKSKKELNREQKLLKKSEKKMRRSMKIINKNTQEKPVQLKSKEKKSFLKRLRQCFTKNKENNNLLVPTTSFGEKYIYKLNF